MISCQSTSGDYLSVRKAQNRASQRAYRERKARRLQELEASLAELNRAHDESLCVKQGLIAQKNTLEFELMKYRCLVEPREVLLSLPPPVTIAGNNTSTLSQLDHSLDETSSSLDLFAEYTQSPESEIHNAPAGSRAREETPSVYLPTSKQRSLSGTYQTMWLAPEGSAINGLNQSEDLLGVESQTIDLCHRGTGNHDLNASKSEKCSVKQSEGLGTKQSSAHDDNATRTFARKDQFTMQDSSHLGGTHDLYHTHATQKQSPQDDGESDWATFCQLFSQPQMFDEAYLHYEELNSELDSLLGSSKDTPISQDKSWHASLVSARQSNLPISDLDMEPDQYSFTDKSSEQLFAIQSRSPAIGDDWQMSREPIPDIRNLSMTKKFHSPSSPDMTATSGRLALGPFIGIEKIWNRLQELSESSAPLLDIDSICIELRNGARCTENGLVVSREHLHTVIHQFGLGEHTGQISEVSRFK